ncbi:hypothetical protein [Neisseria animaloris]|uniref:hypothetical protein n=1 Tax=Neisseria animaloris TaxID=326522 RepID=UPI000D3B4A27|nr:hypothetical protein [Neisseria animaloris]
MNQSLDKLEISVYQLVQKFETQIGENKRLQQEIACLHDEITRQKLAQEQQKNEHEAAVDELSEALLIQVNKLKDDLQGKINSLIAENQKYRDALKHNAEHIHTLLARLPQEITETSGE